MSRKTKADGLSGLSERDNSDSQRGNHHTQKVGLPAYKTCFLKSLLSFCFYFSDLGVW